MFLKQTSKEDPWTAFTAGKRNKTESHGWEQLQRHEGRASVCWALLSGTVCLMGLWKPGSDMLMSQQISILLVRIERLLGWLQNGSKMQFATGLRDWGWGTRYNAPKSIREEMKRWKDVHDRGLRWSNVMWNPCHLVRPDLAWNGCTAEKVRQRVPVCMGHFYHTIQLLALRLKSLWGDKRVWILETRNHFGPFSLSLFPICCLLLRKLLRLLFRWSVNGMLEFALCAWSRL